MDAKETPEADIVLLKEKRKVPGYYWYNGALHPDRRSGVDRRSYTMSASPGKRPVRRYFRRWSDRAILEFVKGESRIRDIEVVWGGATEDNEDITEATPLAESTPPPVD